MASGEKIISRDEVLGGLSGRTRKQAHTLLTLIENRTARLAAQSQPALGFILAEKTLQARNQAFLEALALNRELPQPPSIQNLERFAPEWAALLPDNPDIRAAVAHNLGQKYSFTYRQTPRLRAALGLDATAVAEGYQRLYQEPLATIFARQDQPLDWLRWNWAKLTWRLEGLPPFWLACILTVIIGAVTLALPIAVAGIGPLPGVALIILIGFINMITIAAMAETVTRSGNIRYGSAFIGRVAADYLGQASSALLSIVLAAFSFGLLLVFYLGISSTLAGATGLPAEGWMVLLFLVGLYFLSRGSLNATLALTIVIGLINMALLLTLSLLALTHWRLENLLHVNLPLLNGQPFDPTQWSAVIGVILGIYSAHILVVIFGKMLLRRDPSGRAVIKGHTAGIGLAIILNVIWVLAVSGAVAPEALASQTGTALVPLTAAIGPVMGVLGAIFVIVSMGLGLVQFSLALFNLARERLEAQRFIGLGPRGRFFAALFPVVAVFGVAEWLSFTNSGSFAGILGLLGVLVDSLMAGIFPALLLAASRRKGDIVPGVSYHFLGHPLLLITIYLLFLANLFFHGLVIWQNPIQRAGGIVVGLLILGLTLLMLRRRAFAPRLVVELRAAQSDSHPANLAIVDNGQPAVAEVRLGYTDGAESIKTAALEIPKFPTLRFLNLRLPSTQARELKLWTHRLTPEGDTAALPALAKMSCPNQEQEFELGQLDGQVITPLGETECQVDIRLKRQE